MTPSELFELHVAKNQALTEAAKHNLRELLKDVENEPCPNEVVVKDLIHTLLRTEKARQISKVSLNISNGKEGSFEEIRDILEGFKETEVSSLEEPIDTDLDALLKGSENNTKWKFNIRSLRNEVEGVGPGLFTIIGARPEAGKTASWISFCAAPEGFVEQGAKISAFLNEEEPHRTALRFVSSSTGVAFEQIASKKEHTKAAWDAVRDKCSFYNASLYDIEGIHEIILRDNPDIVIVDQLDKVKIDGTFNRGDERLRELYKRARDSSKTTNTAYFAISQISADGHGHSVVDYSMLEGSRTGKAAEADLIIAIGANAALNNCERYLNLTKNKISGSHESVTVQLDHSLSRMTV